MRGYTQNRIECCKGRGKMLMMPEQSRLNIFGSPGGLTRPFWFEGEGNEEQVSPLLIRGPGEYHHKLRNLLLWKVRYCAHHVLDELLPPKSDAQHNLRKRRHNLTLPEKKGHLTAKNFIIRLLYKDTY